MASKQLEQVTEVTGAALADTDLFYVRRPTADRFARDLKLTFAELQSVSGGGGGGVETAASIKTKYESNADTNAFDDAALAKLAGVEASADVTDTTNVTAAGALMDSEVTDLAGVKAVTISTLQVKPSEGAFANGDKTKLDGIAAGAQVNPTGAVIKGLYEGETNTNAFTDAHVTKLAGIETGADVTDTTNVTAAGALMDSEVDANIKTLVLPGTTTISAFGKTLLDDADAATARATLETTSLGEATESVESAGRNLADTDWGKVLRFNMSGGAYSLTVPTGLTKNRGVNVELSDATYTLTIAASGTTITGTNTLTTANKLIYLYHTNTQDVYRIYANEAAASGDALVANPLSQFAATTSAQLAGVISDETGSGAAVFANSPTLVTPALGTPSSCVATNLTGTAAGLTAGNVTTNANLTGHITSTGNAAVLGSFTSLQLKTALTDETGSGAAVFATSPTLVTPALGTPSSVTLSNASGLPVSTGISGLGAGVATMLATPTSANLKTAITDETGSGALVFASSPTLVTPVLGTPASGNLSNCTALNATQLTSGTIPAARMPAATDIKGTHAIVIACSDETTALTTGVAKATFRMPYAFTLTAVRCSVTTAPTGAVLTVDINETATTILSTKLTLDVSEKTSTTAATPAVISDSSLADDAEITIDIDTVGSTVAGAGLKVYLIGYRT